ncbi:MAG: tRNA uridine-5-carboxymethylaminomethyl(34) synthesis GTPase MnmE [Bacteroidota bacterium]|jgi:tRNA modification GTPase
MNPLDDVIAAIATPIGEGGISIIRISGKDAIAIADKGFRGKQPLASAATHTAHFGGFIDPDGNAIDEVIATVFLEPHSYTAENSVEISCHGGMFVTRKILDSIVAYGARPAEPGEFTKRAFLNGRIDLSQAEAVADLIHARSEISHRTSLQQLEGKLSIKVAELRQQLLDVCGLLELELDFAEEGLEFTDKGKISRQIESVIEYLNQLIDSYKYGRVYREGFKVVLAGKPNVGKSSILNMLLNENRAIVTEIPGTTRDVIEENVVIDGLLFRIVDTAGMRKSEDFIEIEGIRRAESQLQTSDLIVLVLDAGTGFKSTDKNVFDQLLKEVKNRNFLVAENKIDLLGKGTIPDLPDELKEYDIIKISAKTGAGFGKLKKKLVGMALSGSWTEVERSLVITSSRHRDSFQKAVRSLSVAMESLNSSQSNEFVAVDLRAALDSLGEIIGVVTTDDIVHNIFSRFCIGK